MDSESEEEYDYYNYGTQKNGSFMVAGGGLMNGNAYATIIKKKKKYYYCEFGRNAYTKYIGDIIVWSDERQTDGCGNFNIN